MSGNSNAILRILLLAFLAGSGTVQASEDADSIRSLRAESNQAIAAHDVDAIISLLDDEYVITASSGDTIQGRAKNAESWTGHFADFPDVVYVRTPAEVNISEAFPVAIETGTWVGSMMTEHGKLEKGGQYTAGWRKVAGVWKIRSELFVALYCHGVDC
jgi:ketosteroid isomerase-like protein